MLRDSGQTAHHIIPVRVLAIVFGVLIALTVITVITARLDLGALNVPLALAIAASKAALVVAVFMALRYDNRVNALVFFIGSIFVLVFLALTLSDTALRGALGMVDAGVIADEVPLSVSAPSEGIPGVPDGSTLVAAEDSANAAAANEETPVAVETDTVVEAINVPAATELPIEEEVVEPGTDVAQAIDGGAVYTRYLCQTCHSTDGTAGAGPTLQGIGARQSRDEIRSSIMDPDAVVMVGFAPGVMTATLTALRFFNSVTEDELEALIDYIVSL